MGPADAAGNALAKIRIITDRRKVHPVTEAELVAALVTVLASRESATRLPRVIEIDASPETAGAALAKELRACLQAQGFLPVERSSDEADAVASAIRA